MRNSFKIMSIRGIAIYVHWSWLLAVAFITWSLGDYYRHLFPGWSAGTATTVGAISAVLLFATVLVHELSHSFTARAHALPVREITLFIFGGVSNLTQEPPTPRAELLIALAGPLASLVLAGLFFALHALLHGAASEVLAVLGYLASVNLILAIFNLIPGFPLDGGRVLRAIVWMLTGSMRRATHIASNVGQAIGYLLILAGLFEALVLSSFAGGIWLAFVGWFLQNSAQNSYQRAVMDRVLMGVDVQHVMDHATAVAPPTISVETLVYEYMLGGNRRVVAITGPETHLRGLATLTDVNRVPREQWASTAAIQIMTPADQLCAVEPGQDLRSALRILAENDYDQLPVVQNGNLVGMLNRGHVLQYVHVRERLAAQGEDVTGGSQEIPRAG